MSRPADHWLWRLSVADWMAAARHELALAEQHLQSRRKAVTHARRAAGMALNGVLVAMADRDWSEEKCEQEWGRSYLDHIRHVANTEPGGPITMAMTEPAQVLAGIAVVPDPSLVQLSSGPRAAAEKALTAAHQIVEACAQACTPG